MIDWKKIARERLRDYPLQVNALISIPTEIKTLQVAAESIRSATTDSTPVQGGGNKREEMLLSNIVRREELGRNLEQAQMRVENVDRALDLLDAEDQALLKMFYIRPVARKVEAIMDMLGLEDQRSVYKRLDKAMLRFTLAYYGITES